MSDRKQCIECNRTIDAAARSCPYCNWDQSEPPRPKDVAASMTPVYIPPKDNRIRNRVLGTIGFVVLLIAAFSIGSLIHGFEPSDTQNANAKSTPAASAVTTAAVPQTRSNVTLVTVNDAAPTGEAPITSAPPVNPAQGVPNEYQRNDATAASSAEYAQLAARAQADAATQARQQAKSIDPRTLRGAAANDGGLTTPFDSPRDARPRKSAQSATPANAADDGGRSPATTAERATARTAPVPQFQPLPQLHVSQNTTVRLDLSIDSDGRVSDVDVHNMIPGQTTELIAAVHAWRFRPATENGQPVPSHFSVDVTFHGNE